MDNEIIPSQQDANSVSLYNQTLEQFKSLFYLVKGKRDTQIKLYNENKSFSKSSIVELNTKIQEKLLLHSISNKLTTIAITLSNNTIKSYGNWQEFLNERWDTSDKTQSVTVNWEFEIVIPNRVHTLPQTHSLKVRFGQELKPNEFIHIMMIGGDEFEYEESQAQMVAKVDFVNAIIANELLEKVNEWYKALPLKKEENSTNVFLHKHSRKLIMLAEVLIIIGGFALLLPIAEYLLNSSKNLITNSQFLKCNFYLVTGAFIIYAIFTRLGLHYSRKLDNTIDRLQGTPLFDLTNGDRNELEKILKKNKSLRREIYLKIFVSLISTGILYALGQLIKYIFEQTTKSSS